MCDCLYVYIPSWKLRRGWLLLASYFFYMCWNPKYIVLILTSTVITYLCGIGVSRFSGDAAKQKGIIAVGFVSNLLILGFFKYFNFFMDSIQSLFALINVELVTPKLDVLLPVGISFYTFQALAYIVDVYRGDIEAEHNFMNYALFVSFFPQLVAGPIERSRNLLNQIKTPQKFDYDNVRYGLMLMLWGYFEKMVISDRVAIIVDEVYDNYEGYTGLYIIIATVLFAVQIYCDFGGYSHIAIGAAQVMGFKLMKNFNQPYFSESVQEFWKRWHISLSSWFKDYLYIPMGGSRCSKGRRVFNLMVTFLVSGLWHGASWHFVVWGGLNGAFQVIGMYTKRCRGWLIDRLHMNTSCSSWHFGKKLVTFILVDFAWLFFRAQTMQQAFSMIYRSISVCNPWILFDESLYGLGVDRFNFHIMIFSIFVLLMVDIAHERQFAIRKWYAGQNMLFRWLGYIVIVMVIVLFGVYGVTYDSTQFIYFQF